MNDIDQRAMKEAGRRIGAVKGAQAADVFGKLWVNWAAENPHQAEELFSRLMAIALSAARDLAKSG